MKAGVSTSPCEVSKPSRSERCRRAPRSRSCRRSGSSRMAKRRAASARSSRPAGRSRAARARWERRRPGCHRRRDSTPCAVTMNGTGFVECAVFGEPSGSSMLSALPWSAVTISAPPLSCTASTTRPRHSSTASIALTAAGITPEWPTMSGFAKLRMPKRGEASFQPSMNASAAARALISGFRRRWRRRAATRRGGAPPPPTPPRARR